jgi:DNA-binding Lrp family transcriptional regulator
MDAPYSPLEFSLLNDWQHDFPLDARPFAALAAKVGAGETAVIDALRRLAARGAISRIGAVFAPRRIGAGTLAAVAVAPERIEEVAALINAHPGVNHNYQREHRYNLWFVATATDQAALADTLNEIAATTCCAPISMPLLEEFHIDLGFNLGPGHRGSRRRTASAAAVARELSVTERALAAALQDGLKLVAAPYAELAARAGCSEVEALAMLRGWLDEGIVKRLGVVVRHHELGYRANAMLVFDVPDEVAGDIGRTLAQDPAVTLCYRRQRRLPEWNANLYCMVHGRSREDVAPVIARLAERAGSQPQVLFSVRRFKQCGARYF